MHALRHSNTKTGPPEVKGKTPAEAAGIEVKGKNKWLTIIQNAKSKRWNFITEDFPKGLLGSLEDNLFAEMETLGTLLDLLNDPVKSEQLRIALEAAIKSLLMANSGIIIDPNRFADFPNTQFVRFDAQKLRSWRDDDNSICNFIRDSANGVVQNLKTLGITTVGSINAKIIQKEQMIEVAITY